MKTARFTFVFCAILWLSLWIEAFEVKVSTNGTNQYQIHQNGKVLAINGTTGKADLLLLTHNRRDIVEAARPAVGPATQIYAPFASKELLEGAKSHWQNWWLKRFDYYGQQVTKIPTRNFPAHRYLADGDTFDWEGLSIRFLSLPGFTKDGGGYVLDVGKGNKTIFTGELILADGKVPDLYSFQNEIPAAKIGNYHGHLGRLSDWLQSIAKLQKENPTNIYPARGKEINNPEADLSAAAKKARDIYRNYISTNALHWYFGEERMGTAAELVLGKDHGVKGMPLAEHVDLPEWCHHIGTTKLLVSDSKRGFALDVGGRNQFESLFKYQATGIVDGVDGIFVTHTHNDHSAFVMDAERELKCPIYATREVADVLLHPGNSHLPGIPNKPVQKVITMEDGATMKWEEFTFTFRFFPGQMYNHGALLVEKPGHKPVFFIGDSFSPSGIDDYCLMNRNLMRDDVGFLQCFDIVETLPEGSWLVNQHINHLFRFTKEELQFLRSSYLKRRDMIADFVPWDDPNFAVDEQWAWFYPYGQTVAEGKKASANLRVWNHSPEERTFDVSIHGNEFVKPIQKENSLTLAAGQKGEIAIQFSISPNAPKGTQVYTASITSAPDIELNHWIEGLLHTGP